MEKFRTINGYRFEYNQEYNFYECRGDVCYDDEHDETPEPELWNAADELVEILKGIGFKDAERDYSEKGWVEVSIF